MDLKQLLNPGEVGSLAPIVVFMMVAAFDLQRLPIF